MFKSCIDIMHGIVQAEFIDSLLFIILLSVYYNMRLKVITQTNEVLPIQSITSLYRGAI